jgi:hypothetical protein
MEPLRAPQRRSLPLNPLFSPLNIHHHPSHLASPKTRAHKPRLQNTIQKVDWRGYPIPALTGCGSGLSTYLEINNHHRNIILHAAKTSPTPTQTCRGAFFFFFFSPPSNSLPPQDAIRTHGASAEPLEAHDVTESETKKPRLGNDARSASVVKHTKKGPPASTEARRRRQAHQTTRRATQTAGEQAHKGP